jgi:hypothetical protein
MPIHSKSKSHGGDAASKSRNGSAPKRSATFAAGGAKNSEHEGAEATRSAVTGRQFGRAAIRAINKNADAVYEYLDSVLSASSLPDLQVIISKAFILGHVNRQLGAGRLSVTLQTGEKEANLPIKGVLKFKGRANTDAKKERGNTMMPGDFILVDGGVAAGRLTKVQAERVRRTFQRHALPVPAGFFGDLDEEDDEEEGGFRFDRSEEALAEEAAEEARLAAEARRAIVKAGGAGRGGAPRVSVHDARAALAEREDGEAGADREEEEDDGMPAAAVDGAEKPKPIGPNRAERRAAALRAIAEAEAAAAAAAAGFDLYGGADEEEDYAPVALPHAANKGWEELADELDIDAI